MSSVMGGGGRGGGGGILAIAPMIIKFGTDVKLDVFYTMVQKSLRRRYYYVIMTS